MKREKDLRTVAEVERELKATYEIEQNKMVKAHQKELTDMAAAWLKTGSNDLETGGIRQG